MNTKNMSFAAIGTLGVLIGFLSSQFTGCTKAYGQLPHGGRLQLIESENLGPLTVALVKDTGTNKEFLVCTNSTPVQVR